MGRYVSVDVFSSMTGYTAKAIERKIVYGEWLEGREYRLDTNRRLMIKLNEGGNHGA